MSMSTTPTGLQYEDQQVGTGPQAQPGQTCVMHYTGWLWFNGQRGPKFDSSVDRGQPFSFRMGVGQVIAGWEQGIAGMQVGGRRVLVIPPELGYGPYGAGGVIPPHATLYFEVQLLELV